MNDPDSLFGERSLSKFYEALSKDRAVKVAIGKRFGTKAKEVLDMMQSGLVAPDQEDELNDLLLDLLGEKGEPAVEFVGRGDFDEFPITVMCFGPVYWVSAMEFDDIGFFDDVIAASEAATSNYEPFITHASEQTE